MIVQQKRWLRPNRPVSGFARSIEIFIRIISIAVSAPVIPANNRPLPERAPSITHFLDPLNIRPPKVVMKESFLALSLLEEGHERAPPAPIRAKSSPSEDYTEVFLCHARLYVFAEQYDIQPLKGLAFQNVQQALAAFSLVPERVGDVVALTRYIYEKTSEPINAAEPMRYLLQLYIGYQMATLIETDDFEELLRDDEEFLSDFCSLVKRRITYSA